MMIACARRGRSCGPARCRTPGPGPAASPAHPAPAPPLAKAAVPAAARSRSRLPPPRPARAIAGHSPATAGSCAHQCRTGLSPARSPACLWPRSSPTACAGPAPMITRSITSTSSLGMYLSARRGNTTSSWADPHEPRLATAPGQGACQIRATPNHGGQPQTERPAEHLTRACAGPGGLKRHKLPHTARQAKSWQWADPLARSADGPRPPEGTGQPGLPVCDRCWLRR